MDYQTVEVTTRSRDGGVEAIVEIELGITSAREVVQVKRHTAEFEEYLSAFGQEQLPDGRQRVGRNGHLPERKILSGLGEVDVRVPILVDLGSAEPPAHLRGGRRDGRSGQ